MIDKKRDEIIRNLRNYAIFFDDDTIEQYLLLIESYSSVQLQKLFLEKNPVAVFLEDFLVRCFEVNLYMQNLSVEDISDIGDVLQGDDGSIIFQNLLGYYGWLSQMGEYFCDLGVSCASSDYYYSQQKTMFISKIMRTKLFDLNTNDPAYEDNIGNFVEVFTTQLEDLLEDFLSACYLSICDHNIYELEKDFINYNESKLEILATNNRTYDKIIDRILRRIDIISDDISQKDLRLIVKAIFEFRIAQADLLEKEECLRRVLESE